MRQTRPYLVLLILCSTVVMLAGCPFPQVTTPNVSNQELSAAESTLSAAGLRRGTVTYQAHVAIPAGWVIRQEPVAGTLVPHGTAITLYVSNGSIFTTVPDISDIPKSDAEEAVLEARLRLGTVTGQRHPTAPAGTVLHQDPPANTRVIADSEVTITISSGNVLRVHHDSAAAEPDQDGLTWATAFNTLQEALDTAALQGDREVWVAAGSYDETRPHDADGSLRLVAFVDLYGGFTGTEVARAQADPVANETIIDGTHGRGDNLKAYHVVKGADDVIFDGFTITGGDARGTDYQRYGGGMLNERASPTVSRCIFTMNIAYQGGGMSNLEYAAPVITACEFRENIASWSGGMSNTLFASATITDCLFVENDADFGGGLGNTSEATSLISNCDFIENTAQLGGGMVIWYSAPTIRECRFRENVANRGGGLCSGEATPVVTACDFSQNSAVIGGGIYNTDTAATMTNCLIYRNSAERGGGIYNAIDASKLIHCTVTLNTAEYGGGLFNSFCASCPEVVNSIFWDNTATTEGMEMYDESAMPVVTHSCIEGGYPPGSTVITSDPRFQDVDNNDFRLGTGSSCIDAGTDDALAYPDLPATDIRGMARPQGVGYDIGAYEME